MKNLIIIVCILLSFTACKDKQANSKAKAEQEVSLQKELIKTGDIIFQTSTSAQSQAIQLATNSKYSHIGIVFKNETELYVLEAVQPVKLTPIDIWIKRGENAHFIIKRLKSAKDGLSEKEENKMIKEGKKHLAKDYDLAFEWSNKKMYCSELVWKIYKKALGIKLSSLKRLSDFDLDNELVAKKLTERYGDKIPLKEKVVSPSDIFESELLYTVIGQ